jgi:membrane complex biogenesis BtpA family protein
MSNYWTEEIFGTKKPIIAMCHFSALPGDPGFDKAGGIKEVINWARKDLEALQNGGVDGILFSNEFSMPYMTQVEPITIACMARIIGELMLDIKIPFGVNIIWDPTASLDLAMAVGGKFVREVFTGVYAGDFGLWNTNCGAVVRHQHNIGAEKVKLLFNIVPEASNYLADRDEIDIARSTVFNTHPDALCVSALTAGMEVNTQILEKVKNAVPDTVVLVNNGLRMENLSAQLSVADGGVVGTTFKFDGKFENHVDECRVKAFMDKVKAFRKN